MTFEEAKRKLDTIGQAHLLKYYEELSQEEKKALLDQIDVTDFSVINTLSEKQAEKKGVIAPLKSMTLPEIAQNRAYYLETGMKALKDQKIAAVLLAGGMGTRLGSDAPKGVYDIGETKHLYIFECLIRNLMDVVKMIDTYLYLFVMTSDKNHEATVAFFQEHDYFGYPKEYIRFFRQEMAPAVDYQGKVILEEKGKIATSPNGNGGWFVSMDRADITDLIHEKGIEWLNVFAVDNVLQKIADPVFVGACVDKACSVGAKVVRKANPHEKVGVVCLEDGKPSIIEYYELTEEMANQKDENGEYVYNFGVILNYLFSVEALEDIMAKKLPLHTVEKKIAYVNENGEAVKPEQPNGYKFEQLVLDMIHEMDSCLPYEVVREQEFAPIKNKEGVDSVESARALLKQNGVEL